MWWEPGQIFARGNLGAGAAGTSVLARPDPLKLLFFCQHFQAPDPGKSWYSSIFFLLGRLSPGLFVIALPLGINTGKTFTQYRLQLPLVYKVRREMKEMIAKSPASDNSL